MEILKLTVFDKRKGPILGRHPWIFSGALKDLPDGIAQGTIVDVSDERGNFIARGYFGSYAQIAVRVLSLKQEEIDVAFFERKIAKAQRLREKYIPSDTNAYRLINAENDGIPGLIVDNYAGHLIIQCHTKGIEVMKNMIVTALCNVLSPVSIFERSDVLALKKDDGEMSKSQIFGETPDEVLILEHGFKFYVDLKEGQKTGFFLDQREKRYALMKYCKDAHVLNTFCYSGGFTVYALAGGAVHVTSIDVSAKAIELAKKNVLANGFDTSKVTFVVEDVKKFLPSCEPGSVDVIILDPPAFIKDRKKKEEGIFGYKKINEMAMNIISDEGILISCSCSNHLTLQDFRYLLSECGSRTRSTLQLIETHMHDLDHPELVPYMEGGYLKTLFLRVLKD